MIVEIVSGFVMLVLLLSFTVVVIKYIPTKEETKEFAPYFYLGISIFRFFSLGIGYVVSTKFFEADYVVLAAILLVVFVLGVVVELYMKKTVS